MKKKRSIPEDEGQSFADIHLSKIMEWPVTSKPWSICKEENKSRANQISLFRNHLELFSSIPPTTTLPQGIHISVVDAI